MYRQKTAGNWPNLGELSSSQELVNYFLTIHHGWFWDLQNSLYGMRLPANDYLESKVLEHETGRFLPSKEIDRLDESQKTYLWMKFSTEFFNEFEYVHGNMLQVLRDAVKKLEVAGTFKNWEAWQSLYIDYEKPHVERLWTPVTVGDQNYRLYLHRIHPCERHEALYHPHPWPSAMVICDGVYEMGLGYGRPNDPPPPVMGPFYLPAWSAYQMLSPLEWHYVRPLGHDCMTIMITGVPFPKTETEDKPPRPKMRELTRPEKDCIYRFFSGFYGTTEMIVETIDKYLRAENECNDG
jgi:hypothetical protein